MARELIMDFKRDMPLYSLTVGEFEQYITAVVHKAMGDYEVGTKGLQNKRVVYGLTGLAELLACSISTAGRIKQSGILNEAITQIGKKIVVDVDKALDLYKLSKQKER